MTPTAGGDVLRLRNRLKSVKTAELILIGHPGVKFEVGHFRAREANNSRINRIQTAPTVADTAVSSPITGPKSQALSKVLWYLRTLWVRRIETNILSHIWTL